MGVAILPLCDVQRAVDEATRAVGLGARAVSFPYDLGTFDLPTLYSGKWSPLFATLEEAGIPLLIHIGKGVGVPEGANYGSFGALLTYMNFDVLTSVTDVVFSGILLDYPQLRVGFIEGGAAWLPYMAERMDFFLKRDGVWDMSPGVPRPSELLARNVYASFIDDPNGIRWRDQIGVDRMLWQSDFPHRDSFWPESRQHLEMALADVPAANARQIAEDTARELLGLPRPSVATSGGAPEAQPDRA